MGVIFYNFINQVIFSIGILILFGVLIGLCNKLFCEFIGNHSYKVMVATGIIGTPIHEASHALACLIFGHKIDEIKFFQVDSETGILGYVYHSYNPRNIYHKIGNFFISTAPLLGGSLVIFLLMKLFTPTVFDTIQTHILNLPSTFKSSLDSNAYFVFFEGIQVSVSAIFSLENLSSITWWIFIILAIMISMHMSLSMQDIRSGAFGLLIIIGFLFLLNVILAIFSENAVYAVTSFLMIPSVFTASFLSVSLIFSLIYLLIGLLIKLIRRT